MLAYNFIESRLVGVLLDSESSQLTFISHDKKISTIFFYRVSDFLVDSFRLYNEVDSAIFYDAFFSQDELKEVLSSMIYNAPYQFVEKTYGADIFKGFLIEIAEGQKTLLMLPPVYGATVFILYSNAKVIEN